jgi:CheY-like chemotaxis protein
VRIALLLEQLVHMFRLQAEAKGLMFIYECKDRLPEFVRTDEKRLRQILINLLSNAIKYTTKGNVTFTIRYRNQVAEFIVSDTGEGIAPENLERIFRPFERLRRPGSTSTGTGLGLTITRLLTEIMGGDISLVSRLDEGSQFKISLMLSAITPKTDQAAVQIQKPILAYKESIKRLMVVDDESTHRELMKSMLLPLGFDVIEIDNPLNVLAKLEEEKAQSLTIDLFMLDVSMPGLNGWDLAKQLRDAGYYQPIMMVSADASEGRALSVTPLNDISDTSPLHQAYVIKPVRLHLLLDHIGRLLNLTWQYEKNIETENIVPEIIASDKAGEITEKDLDEIARLAAIGHKKGLVQKINQLQNSTIYKQHDEVFLKKILQHANHFQFEVLLGLIDEYTATTEKY